MKTQPDLQQVKLSSASQTAPNGEQQTNSICGRESQLLSQRLSWIILLLTIVSCSTLSAQDTTLLPWRLIANISGNGNFHSSSFSQLPGIPNCCVEFTGGTGFGLTLGAGAEYLPKKPLLGMNYRLGGIIRFSSIGAPLKETNFFANIIVGNTVQKGTSEHLLDASFSLLSAEPYIYIQPTSLPLGISLGIEAGTFLGASYSQKETLLTPSNAVFETGTTTRNEVSGSIPESAGLYAGINLAARYDVYQTESLTLSPEVSYTYGITNLVSSLQWKASVLRAGISAQYQLRKSSPILAPPPPPPPPPPPTPPVVVVKPKQLSITVFKAVYNNVAINNHETLLVDAPSTQHVFTSVLVPKVFYSNNTSQFNPEQQSLLDAVVQQCLSDTTLHINILGSAATDEPPTIATQRAEVIASQLRSSGITARRIHVTTTTKAPSAVSRYPELLEEMRSVTLSLSNTGKRNVPISTIKYDTISNVVPPSDIRVYTSYKSDTTITNATLSIATNGNTTTTQANEENYIKLSPESLGAMHTQQIGLTLNVSDGAGNQKDSRIQFTVQPKRNIVSTLHNIVNTDNGDVSEWIVGFCDFDKPTFYQINSEVFPQIREYVAKGRKVELIALTDNLGTDEHNTTLAQARAREAMRLIGLSTEQVVISLKPSGIHTNTTPMGRSMNRAVVIRIATE